MSGTEGLSADERREVAASMMPLDGDAVTLAQIDSVIRTVERILATRTAALTAERDALREQVARVEALRDEINPWKRPAMSQVEIYRALDAALHPTDGAS